MGQPIKARLR